MKNRSLLVLLVMQAAMGRFAVADATTVTLKPLDFAYGQNVEPSSEGSIYRFPLTESVYRGLARADLRDLRIFNAQGEVCPFQVEHRTAERVDALAERPLNWFPIEGNPSPDSSEEKVHVKEDASGKIIQVEFTGGKSAKSRGARAYLLDLRKQELPLKALIVDWTATEQNKVVELNVEASENLRTWTPVVTGAAVTQLTFQKEKLEQKRIELPESRHTYLKITWDRDQAFSLSSLAGEFSDGKDVVLEKVKTLVSGHPKAETKDEYLYDAKAMLPTDSVRVALATTNTLVRLRLSSSQSETGPWSDRYSGTVFRALVDGKDVASPPLKLDAAVADRYWSLKVEGSETAFKGTPPDLELAWVPHQLTYLAKGLAPFRLAYGSAIAPAVDFDLTTLLEGVKISRKGEALQPADAKLSGKQIELGGPSRLIAPVEATPAPWKKAILWALLGLTVALVATMAFRLSKELS